MNIYQINKKSYYLANDLMKSLPQVFKGCNVAKTFVSKHKLDDTKYVYARNSNNKWAKSDGSSRKFDKLFLEQSWFDKKYLKNDKYIDTIELAPEIIELDDSEKFYDNNGNIVKIEVRGEREFEKCYFRVSDIAKGFEIKRVDRTILDPRNDGYIIDKHYKFFYILNEGNNIKDKIKKLYLTYEGLLRVLFASHNKTTGKFIKWATETLFTAQLGNSAQKSQLASNLLGVHPDAVKAVFNKSVNTLPCIYLFSIGKVCDLRKALKIPTDFNDKDYVYKWGMTIDLERRTKEHHTDYGKIKGTNLELVLFGFIDTQYISEAETKIAHLFEDMNLKLDHPTFNELAIISKKKMRTVKQNYDSISKSYLGHIADLINKLKEKDYELKAKDQELKMKDQELKMKDQEKELIKKELEIANLKLKYTTKSKNTK